LSRNAYLKAENSQFAERSCKIKILSTYNFLYRKYSVPVGKLQFLAPPTFYLRQQLLL